MTSTVDAPGGVRRAIDRSDGRPDGWTWAQPVRATLANPDHFGTPGASHTHLTPHRVRDTPEWGVGWTTGAGGGVRERSTEGRGRPRYVTRVPMGPGMMHPRSCPRPVGGFTRVLRSPDLKWLVRFCQTGPVAPRRRGRSRNSLGRAKCPGSLDKTTVHLPDSRGEPRKSVPRASDTPECGDR